MFTKWVLLTKKADVKPDGVSGIFMAPLMLQQISLIYLQKPNICYQQMLTFQQITRLMRCWFVLIYCLSAIYLYCQPIITTPWTEGYVFFPVFLVAQFPGYFAYGLLRGVNIRSASGFAKRPGIF